MTVLLTPAKRGVHAMVAAVAPAAAGRWATDAFSRTRALGVYPDNVLPLGATAFEVTGNPDVQRGYLWGTGGPVALLVHGWGADSSSMYSLIPTLRALGYTVAAFDAPGHGICAGNQATMTQYTDAATAVLRTLGGVRVVIAHSLGSIAAVGALGRVGTDDLDCLALVAPTCTLGGVLERWRPAGFSVSRPVVERIYRELHRRNGVPVTHWDISTLGAGFDRPVLVIHDPDDPVVPFGEAELVAAALRDCRLVAADGGGHAAILMSPQLKRLLTEFIGEHAWIDHGAGGLLESEAP
jgi:pimeloyl-ACP methyl ester carboxylesterase